MYWSYPELSDVLAASNQGRVYYHISKALRGIMGDNWGGHGRMVFQIYGGMEGVDGSHKRFR